MSVKDALELLSFGGWIAIAAFVTFAMVFFVTALSTLAKLLEQVNSFIGHAQKVYAAYRSSTKKRDDGRALESDVPGKRFLSKKDALIFAVLLLLPFFVQVPILLRNEPLTGADAFMLIHAVGAQVVILILGALVYIFEALLSAIIAMGWSGVASLAMQSEDPEIDAAADSFEPSALPEAGGEV